MGLDYMKLQKKNIGLTAITVTATFIITIGSISLAADKTAEPRNTAASKTEKTSVEALADGNAVLEIPTIASGQVLFEIPDFVADSTFTTIRQAKADYDAKIKEEKKAAEEAEKKRLEEARIAEEQRLAEEAAQAAAYESVETIAVSQSPAMDVSPSEQELLAALIFCEAGNQPYEGQVAVGAVVMNRVRSGVYQTALPK